MGAKHCWFINISDTVTKVSSLPENITLIEVHEDQVCTELCLVWTCNFLFLQISIQLLEGLQTFGQILVVDFHIKYTEILFTETLSTEDVETCTLLNQTNCC